MSPLAVAQAICMANHDRFPAVARGGTPCAEHIAEAQALWHLTQPVGASTLRAIVELARRNGWRDLDDRPT